MRKYPTPYFIPYMYVDLFILCGGPTGIKPAIFLLFCDSVSVCSISFVCFFLISTNLCGTLSLPRLQSELV